jgi:salicylate hydroxylase
MQADSVLRRFIETPEATCWIGPKGHIMAYPIRNGALFNFVMCHPGSVLVGKPNENASLEGMRDYYRDWDPVITRLINLVPECLKWQNAELEQLETWTSKSGKVLLIGDASHGMVPYMAQGAAMAIEDAVALTECLGRAKTAEDIPQLMNHFVQIRRDRCNLIQDGARNNGNIWHLPDGPEQRLRDEQIRRGSKPKISVDAGDNPNKWSDPKLQPRMFGYDAFYEVRSSFMPIHRPSKRLMSITIRRIRILISYLISH